jgi:hypothetical protein
MQVTFLEIVSRPCSAVEGHLGEGEGREERERASERASERERERESELDLGQAEVGDNARALSLFDEDVGAFEVPVRHLPQSRQVIPGNFKTHRFMSWY